MMNISPYPVKEGDILYCVKETEDLVLHALYRVKGAEVINGDLILAVEAGDGYLRHASLSHFQGFVPAEGWDAMGMTLNQYMEQDGYGEFMNGIHKIADLVENGKEPILDLVNKFNMFCESLFDEDGEDEDCDGCDGCGDCECDRCNGYDICDECDCECGDVPCCESCECYDEYDDKVSRESILCDAYNCVCGQREEDYGTPESNFGCIADMWSAYKGVDISPVDVAAMMALVKIARIASGHAKSDNWVDLAGYAACGGEIEANS